MRMQPTPPLSTREGRLILNAYAQGYFPMAEHRVGEARWYNPEVRSILPLDGLRISRSLRKRIQRGDYTITMDTAFERVIHACAGPRAYSPETWINHQILRYSVGLHRLGYAHSVEAWLDDQGSRSPRLVGGLYGLALGGAFFGESMFSRAPDASKVCLAALVDHLNARGYVLLDTQIANPHMESLGTIEIPRDDFLHRLSEALERKVTWSDCSPPPLGSDPSR